MDEQAIVRILKYSDRYRSERFEVYNRNPDFLLTNWWNASRFLADRLFYRPRSEPMTKAIIELAERALRNNIDWKSPNGLTDSHVYNLSEGLNIVLMTRTSIL